jgi:hypothetical protein
MAPGADLGEKFADVAIFEQADEREPSEAGQRSPLAAFEKAVGTFL